MIEILEQVLAAYSEEVNKRAETAEKQLGIAEKALIEKDEKISIMKQLIGKQNARIKALEEAVEKWQAIVDQKNSNNKQLNQMINALTEQLSKQKLTMIVVREKEKYAAALKDLEGVLCGASNHFKEISNSIHTIVK